MKIVTLLDQLLPFENFAGENIFWSYDRCSLNDPNKLTKKFCNIVDRDKIDNFFTFKILSLPTGNYVALLFFHCLRHLIILWGSLINVKL